MKKKTYTNTHTHMNQQFYANVSAWKAVFLLFLYKKWKSTTNESLKTNYAQVLNERIPKKCHSIPMELEILNKSGIANSSAVKTKFVDLKWERDFFRCCYCSTCNNKLSSQRNMTQNCILSEISISMDVFFLSELFIFVPNFSL